MLQFFPFLILPSLYEASSALIGKQHRAAVLHHKIRLFHHAVVYQLQHKSVRHARPQFFHQVKGERRAPRTVAVHEADVGIQPYAFQRGSAVVGEQHIGEGEQGVHVVLRRAAIAAVQQEIRLLSQYHFVEYRKIIGGCVAFQPAQHI